MSCELLAEDKGKKHAQPEARLHAACIAYLRKHGMLPLGSAASGFRVGMKTAVVAMKDRGMEKDQPDLLVLATGVLLELQQNGRRRRRWPPSAG